MWGEGPALLPEINSIMELEKEEEEDDGGMDNKDLLKRIDPILVPKQPTSDWYPQLDGLYIRLQ